MSLKIDTKCLDCNCEFPEGGLTLYENGWGCPNCGSPNMEPIKHKKMPFKYNEVKSSTPYNGQEEGN